MSAARMLFSVLANAEEAKSKDEISNAKTDFFIKPLCCGEYFGYYHSLVSLESNTQRRVILSSESTTDTAFSNAG